MDEPGVGDIMVTESKEAQTKERSRQQQFIETLVRRTVIAPVIHIPWKIWSSPSRSSLHDFPTLFPLFGVDEAIRFQPETF